MSAIDDIFSRKKCSTTKSTKPSIPEPPTPIPKHTKKSKKKEARQSLADMQKSAVQVVEFKESSTSSIKQDVPVDQDGFGDSRGNSGKRRKIDGLSLYSTEELNIGKGAGDTEDCPFDCQCCY
jgi:hypothetical protein